MTTCAPGRAHALADLIAYAWFQIGFRPRDSVVVVGLQGGRLAGAVARIDRPPRAHESAAIEALLQPLRRTGDTGVVVLLVTDHAQPLPHGRFARRLTEGFAREGFDVLDVVQVGRGHYASYLCADETCCPATGHPIEAVGVSPVAAGMVLRGRTCVATEVDLVADVRPSPSTDPPSGARAAEPVVTRRLRTGWLQSWLRETRRRGRPGDCPAETASPVSDWLLPALEDHTTRDAILVTIAQPGPRGARTARALLAGRFDGLAEALAGQVPDRTVAERARILLSAVARQAPAGRRAEALAALAWVAWWLGEAARSRLLCELALADRPGHRLAALVDQLLRHAVPPPWLAQPDGSPCTAPANRPAVSSEW